MTGIQLIREMYPKLLDEVASRKARHAEGSEDKFCPWQSVLDIGYEWWQAQPKESRISYSGMVRHMRENYGEFAALLVLIGKANQQICNGGVSQYFENGYATKHGGGGCFSEKTDITLHRELVEWFGTYFKGFGEKTARIHDLLVGIEECLSGHLEALEEFEESRCDLCDDNPPELDANGLDDRWYSEELDVEKTISGIVGKIFAA